MLSQNLHDIRMMLFEIDMLIFVAKLLFQDQEHQSFSSYQYYLLLLYFETSILRTLVKSLELFFVIFDTIAPLCKNVMIKKVMSFKKIHDLNNSIQLFHQICHSLLYKYEKNVLQGYGGYSVILEIAENYLACGRSMFYFVHKH